VAIVIHNATASVHPRLVEPLRKVLSRKKSPNAVLNNTTAIMADDS